MTNEVVVPEYSSRLVRIKTENGTENTDQAIAEITSAETPYMVGGPGLIKIDAAGCSLVEVFNTGPEPITLARGQCIGQADNIEGQGVHGQDHLLAALLLQKSGDSPGRPPRPAHYEERYGEVHRSERDDNQWICQRAGKPFIVKSLPGSREARQS